jgi:hypothetical protein
MTDPWAPRAYPVDLCEGVDAMGRGRAKAKQTKVARDLKYRTWDTDLDQLKRELSGDGQAGSKPNGGEHGSADDDETDDYDDRRRH